MSDNYTDETSTAQSEGFIEEFSVVEETENGRKVEVSVCAVPIYTDTFNKDELVETLDRLAEETREIGENEPFPTVRWHPDPPYPLDLEDITSGRVAEEEIPEDPRLLLGQLVTDEDGKTTCDTQVASIVEGLSEGLCNGDVSPHKVEEFEREQSFSERSIDAAEETHGEDESPESDEVMSFAEAVKKHGNDSPSATVPGEMAEDPGKHMDPIDTDFKEYTKEDLADVMQVDVKSDEIGLEYSLDDGREFDLKVRSSEPITDERFAEAFDQVARHTGFGEQQGGFDRTINLGGIFVEIYVETDDEFTAEEYTESFDGLADQFREMNPETARDLQEE